MAANEIRYKGVTYATDQDIWASSGELYETKALKCDSLEANTLSVTVSDSDRSIMAFKKNDKVEYWRDGKLMGIFYLQSVQRVGPEAYTLYAFSAVGLLMTRSHPGGIYTGETAGDVIRSICGSVPVLVESVYKDRKLYGWLPYVQPPSASARDNLAEVLFALGAFLGVDRNGVLRVEKLWDGYSCTIGPDRIYADNCSVKVTDPVSSVEVTEHQWVKSTDEVTLFDGTATAGTLVTFSDPAYDLVGDGVTVLESGANYAVLSAGTGTLKGKSYNHLTRTVSRVVTEDAEENIVTIQDAHLVSITNSADVSQRLAQYYRHRETIQVDTNPHAGPPGAVVQMWHPWDNQYVQATVAQRDTSISGLLKSGTEALVGFTPPQPDESDYYDERVLLTDSGTWTPPAAAETLRVVLIGKGADGEDGSAGTGSFASGRTNQNASSASFSGAAAGAGGAGGAGGVGGKILVINLDLSDAQTFAYDATADDVTFGTHSSAEGTSSDAGYFDSVTQEFFGRRGADGAAGGKGGAAGQRGSSVGDYTGGAGTEALSITYDWTANGVTYTDKGSISGFGGGGAAKGRNGYAANGRIRFQGFGFNPDVHVQSSAQGAPGAKGEDGANYGDGGGGGNGGGGAGAIGSVSVSFSPSAPSGTSYSCGWSGESISGGQGGAKGVGKRGCIILYYRRKEAVKTGPLVEANHKWLLDSLGRWLIV